MLSRPLCRTGTRLRNAAQCPSPIRIPRRNGWVHVDRPVRTPPRPTGKPFVDRLNHAIHYYPGATFGCMVGFDFLSMFGCYAGLKLFGITVSSELALAFALSRPLRRLRFPIEIAVAAKVSRIFPSLAQVEVGRLFTAWGGPSHMVNAAAGQTRVTWRSLLESRGWKDALERLSALSMQAVNRYGIAYNVSSRLLGLFIVGILYVLVRRGVDVQGWLEDRGYGKIGETAGTWAAAVMLTAVVYPVTLIATGAAAPWVGQVVRQRMSRGKWW